MTVMLLWRPLRWLGRRLLDLLFCRRRTTKRIDPSTNPMATSTTSAIRSFSIPEVTVVVSFAILFLLFLLFFFRLFNFSELLFDCCSYLSQVVVRLYRICSFHALIRGKLQLFPLDLFPPNQYRYMFDKSVKAFVALEFVKRNKKVSRQIRSL